MLRFRAEVVSFKLNRKTVAAIAVSRECEDMVMDMGQRARAVLVSLSPRTSREKEHYADQFVVKKVFGTLPAEWPMTRVGARIINESEYATKVEFGGGHEGADGTRVDSYEGHHVFRNALIELEAIHRATP